MSGMSADDFYRRQALDSRGPEPATRARWRRRLRRVTLVAAAGLALVVGVAAGGAFFTARHLASHVQRLPGITALQSADQPMMPAATRKSMTILLTSSGRQPSAHGGGGADGASKVPAPLSGLIALVHLNADKRGGAVVSIPANTVVNIPGHGRQKIWSALSIGGPSLLIRTAERLTNVRINHYSIINFQGVAQVIGAMNGVKVDVPFTIHSQGFTFHAGINKLTGRSVLAYARQLQVSQIGRTQLQSNLIRAILEKIADDHLFSHVSTDYRVLDAMAQALSVDSDMTDAELVSLGLRLGGLASKDGTFITAATTVRSGTKAVFLRQPLARRLWSAIRNDSVAAYARRYPFTVTPGAPG
jgi:LCP family protein required for cell wall assembly